VAAPLRRRGGVSKLRQQGCRVHASSTRRSTWRPARSESELPDHDAPELVDASARPGAAQVCRVAELVRVNVDAKQIRDEELKTHCLLVATT
jgi:hypothetical protein